MGFNIGTGFNSVVGRIAIDSNDKIYCGGVFTSYNSITANRIIRLNPDGTIDTGFNYGTGFSSGSILAIAIDSNGKIYVGGTFTSYKSVTANRIIRLNPDGSKDTGFDNTTGFNAGVRRIAIDSNGKIYVGGDFTSYKSVTANRIIRLNPDGSKDTGFDNTTGFNTASVIAMDIDSNGKIYVGGSFTEYKSVSANYIIRLNPDGTIDTGFNYGTGFVFGGVNAIAIDSNGKIYCGGQFTSYKSVAANRIIRLNPDGTIDTGFNYGTGFSIATVTTISINPNGKIYCGGSFTSYNSITANRIMRLNPDGTIDTGFNYGTGFNSVTDNIISNNDNSIYVGGEFTSYNSQNSNFIIKLSDNGSILTGTTTTTTTTTTTIPPLTIFLEGYEQNKNSILSWEILNEEFYPCSADTAVTLYSSFDGVNYDIIASGLTGTTYVDTPQVRCKDCFRVFYYAQIACEDTTSKILTIIIGESKQKWNLAGLKRLWVANKPLGLDYTVMDATYKTIEYNGNDIFTISGFTQSLTWYELPVSEEANYSQRLAINEQGYVFSEVLQLEIPKLNPAKWQTISGLLDNKLIVVFQTNNDQYCIMGYDAPAIVDVYQASTQDSKYNFSVEVKHNYNLMKFISENYVINNIL